VTLFLYDGNNLLHETDDTCLVKAAFTYIPLPYAEVLSQRRDSDSSFYLFDGIRNIRQLTDDTQVVTDEYAFDAFGSLRSATGSTANSHFANASCSLTATILTPDRTPNTASTIATTTPKPESSSPKTQLQMI